MYIPLSLYLSIYLPIYSSIHLSIYLPIHPSIHLSVHLSVHLSLSLSLSLKIAIWILWHFVCSPPTHYPWVIYGQPGSIRLKLLDHPRPEMKDPWQQRPQHGITGFTVSRFHGVVSKGVCVSYPYTDLQYHQKSSYSIPCYFWFFDHDVQIGLKYSLSRGIYPNL